MPRSEKPSNWTKAPLPKPLSEAMQRTQEQIQEQDNFRNEMMSRFYELYGSNQHQEIEEDVSQPRASKWVTGSIPKPEK